MFRKKIAIKKNLLQYWKKISLFILIVLLFLWSYTFFYQTARKKYFIAKENELQTADISRQYALAAQQRYQNFLVKQTSQKDSRQEIFTEIEFKQKQKILTEKFQELNIIITQKVPNITNYQDFSLWRKKFIFQTKYKPFSTILKLIAKQGWSLSDITITNLTEHSKDPLLKIELLFSVIISKI